MITSPDGDSIVFLGSECNDTLNYNLFFKLKEETDGSYTWVTLQQKLKYRRLAPLLAYIDESKVNCYPKTTPTTTTPIQPGTTGILIFILKEPNTKKIFQLQVENYLSHSSLESGPNSKVKKHLKSI